MHRREFIWLLGVAAAFPLGVAAQQSIRIPHVVHLSPAAYPAQSEAYRSQLKELGYIEGRNIRLEFQNTQGAVDQLPMLAEKLVKGGGIDVFVAESTPAALAAHRATQIIPSVAFVAHDPVASGLVESLARPGGNVTGVSFFAAETTAKRVELIREVAPRALRLGVVVTKVNEGRESLAVAFEIGHKLGLTVEVVTVDDVANLAEELSLTRLAEFDAFVFVPDVVLASHMSEVVKLIALISKPVIYSGSEWVDAGGFMSFGTDILDGRRRALAQLDHSLREALRTIFSRDRKWPLLAQVRRTFGSVPVSADRLVQTLRTPLSRNQMSIKQGGPDPLQQEDRDRGQPRFYSVKRC